MEYKVSQDIIDAAKKCPNNFACLNDKNVVCEVESCAGDGTIFVENRWLQQCNYKSRLGTSFVCRCPVRNELYRRYGI